MLTHTETYDYNGVLIKLNANLKTGEFVAVATARGVTMTGRDLSAAQAVDIVKRKIDEVGK
jgi:hypothetical protein